MFENKLTVFSLFGFCHFDCHKFPNYLDTQKICYNHSKIWNYVVYHRVMSSNDADGMANSVNRICTVCPDLSVRKLRNITIRATILLSHMSEYRLKAIVLLAEQFL